MMKARRSGAAGRRGGTGVEAIQRATERFPVDGLDCAECGRGVRSALKDLPGVQAVAVNVAGQEIAVTFDPARLGPPAIRARLEGLGLGCL
ncbi:MAG: heavy-metal-associated domain-containing protein [Chloroflexota bacterium]